MIRLSVKNLSLITLILCVMRLPLALAEEVAAFDDKRMVELELNEMPGVTQYEVEVVKVSKAGKKPPQSFKFKKALWQAKLKTGKYMFRFRAYDDRNVAGVWSEPAELLVQLPAAQIISPKVNEKIYSHKNSSQDVELKWTEVKGALGYKLKIESLSPQFSKIVRTDNLKESIELKAGAQYQFSVTTIMHDEEDGETTSSQSFILLGSKLDPVEWQKPKELSPKVIHFSKVENAKEYEYSMLYKPMSENSKWVKVLEKVKITQTDIPLPEKMKSGTYKLTTISKSDVYEDSDPSTLEFVYGEQARKLAAIQETRDKIENYYKRKTPFYGLASYQITVVNYTNNNKELGGTVKFNAIGGTGRIGVGYEKKNSNWSYLAIGDVGGYTVNGQTVNFGSVEFNSIYKFAGHFGTDWRVSMGLLTRETPDAKGSPEIGLTITKMQSLGPKASVEFRKTLTPKYGMQASSGVYYDFFALQTPTGQPIVPSLSYFAGIMGSMRLTSNMMGFAGYQYRVDSSSYKARVYDEASGANADSRASNGDVNIFSLSGHYLHFLLEMGF